jgi:hypothetical protein
VLFLLVALAPAVAGGAPGDLPPAPMKIAIEISRPKPPPAPQAFRIGVTAVRPKPPPIPQPFATRIAVVRPLPPEAPPPHKLVLILRRPDTAQWGRGCGAIIGTWRWFNGATVNCGEGSCTASNGFNGSVKCLDPSGRFEIQWTGPGGARFTDTVNVTDNGRSLHGSNQIGNSVSAQRP